MDRPKYRFLAAPKTLDLPPSTSQTCTAPIIPHVSQLNAMPYPVPFRKLYKSKEAVKFNPYEATLEPPVLLACLDFVARHSRN